MKRLPVDAFRRQGRGGKGVRGRTSRKRTSSTHVFTTTTHHWLLFFTHEGQGLPGEGARGARGHRGTARGLYAANLPGVALDGDERICAVHRPQGVRGGQVPAVRDEEGIVKKTALPEYDSPRTGLAAINLKPGDELIDVKLTDGKDEVFLVSRKGQAIRFKESLARPMGRATAGVIGMRLADDDEVIGRASSSEGEEMISVSQQGYGKRSKLADYPVKGRGGKGVIGHQLTKKTGLLAGAFIGSKDQDMFVDLVGRQGPYGWRPSEIRAGRAQLPGRAHDAGRARRHGRRDRAGRHPDGRGVAPRAARGTRPTVEASVRMPWEDCPP